MMIHLRLSIFLFSLISVRATVGSPLALTGCAVICDTSNKNLNVDQVGCLLDPVKFLYVSCSEYLDSVFDDDDHDDDDDEDDNGSGSGDIPR